MSTRSRNSVCTDTIGGRIRAERLRLGLSQDAFSKLAGVHRRTQVNYEANERTPDIAYLEAAAKAGVDVGYILTEKVEDYWHRSLVHLLGVVLTSLHLAKRENEFNKIWGMAYEDYLSFVNDKDTPDMADNALRAFLLESPVLLDSRMLAEVIERIEFVAETKDCKIPPGMKADLTIRLYRAAKETGTPPALDVVMEALRTAGIA